MRTLFLCILVILQGCMPMPRNRDPRRWEPEQQVVVGASCCLLWNPCGGVAMVTGTDGNPSETHEGP